jgi:hypothetical protein
MAKFKILKTGETNINSTDIWRFCVHSDYPTQKIYASGQTTLTVSAGSTTGSATVNHSLGYAPIAMAMFQKSNGRFVKVLGETKSSLSVEVQQFFLVDIAANYIVSYTNLSNPIGSLVNCTVNVNDIVNFDSTTALPSPLQKNTNYYVKSIHSATYPGPETVNVFDVSATLGGPVIDITDSGGANYLYFKNITIPYIVDNGGIYKVLPTTTGITFQFNPTISTLPLVSNKNITIYYIILYEEI